MNGSPEVRWTQDDWGDPALPEPSSLRRFAAQHGWLIRGAIVLLALLVFELTANAALSSAVSCLEFGRTDFGTALWLRRADPDRKRGHLIALCYLAGAFARVGFVGLYIAFGLGVFFSVFVPVRGNAFGMQPIWGTALGAFLSLVASSIISLEACRLAWRSGHKIWLGPQPRLARRQNIWPPSRIASVNPPSNAATAVFWLACASLFVPALTTIIVVCFWHENVVKSWAFLAIVVLMTLGFLRVVLLLEERILAHSPAECWPIDESVSTGRAACL